MERTLSLVLDEEGFVSLTLMKAEADEIDKFTIKKFENSEEIREYYKDKIEKYLEENRNYIDSIEKNTKKKFRGRIVVIEARDYRGKLQLLEKRVLYKKHLFAFKEIVKDARTMKRFLEFEKRGVNEYGFKKLISPFLVREIRYADFYVKARVDLIRRELKKSSNFHDVLRVMIKAYTEERKIRPNLPTIESIYKTRKLDDVKPQPKVANISEKQEENEKFFDVDGVEYSMEEAVLFDLDELNYQMELGYKPDGLGAIDEKRIR